MLNILGRDFSRWFGRGKTRTQQRTARRFRPFLEVLEDRWLPSTYTVNSTGDTGAGSGLFGDLRYCINQANVNPGSTIDFAIATTPGTFVINVTPGGLPLITAPVTINGYTEYGAAANTTPSCSTNATIEIVINGQGTSQFGFFMDNFSASLANHCTIEGLDIENFTVAGVIATQANYNVIQGNFIGTDYTGSAAAANGYGVVISSYSSFNTIGGSTADARNIISANNDGGVFVEDATSSGNTIQGNLIGTDRTGNANLGNGAFGTNGGVLFNFSSNNLVGGPTAVDGNVISANTGNGLFLAGSSGNTVEGNYIGISCAGSALGNTANGVEINAGGSSNTLGGSSVSDSNVISGNGADGVLITGTGTSLNGSALNLVAANYIGTDPTGLLAVPNGSNGVEINDGASRNTVGGLVTAERNFISGNKADGVKIEGSVNGTPGSTLNLVEGNYIGTESTGLSGLGNGANGVDISGAARNTVGGATPAARNIISANVADGVLIDNGGATLNLVAANFIGTDATGMAALANGSNGVEVSSGATSNTIGLAKGPGGNLISGNSADGVEIDGKGTAWNLVQGNRIGTKRTGMAALANGTNGVEISNGASSNTIGGLAAGARNLISGNSADGILIDDVTSTLISMSNLVEGNYIGTKRTGMAALANGTNGVEISNGASSNTIGGTSAAARNLISGNDRSGVHITGSATTGNLVEGNFIGTDKLGTSAIANLVLGVLIDNGALKNFVGGFSAGAGNLISGNQTGGVVIGYSSPYNFVQYNLIGTNRADNSALPNVGINQAGGVTVYSSFNIIQFNVISGNTGTGVGFGSSGASYNLVISNDIGTDATHSLNLGNTGIGVSINGGTYNTLQLNYIYYNLGDGVLILDGPSFPGQPADFNVIGAVWPGTTNPSNGNYIWYNSQWGIEIQPGNTGNSYEDDLVGFPSGVLFNGFGNFSIAPGNYPT